jgi:hypothetical protein
MSKYNVTEAAVTKPEVPASKKKKTAGRTVKLKSGDLPIKEPVKYELVINLKTAEVLGLTVPTSMQLLADKVIK